MITVVVGANGATGSQLVRELLNRHVYVKIIVRGTEKLPNDIRTHKNLTILDASILQLSESEIGNYIKDCDAIASCLGHNISLKGIFGNPKLLVTDAVIKLCNAMKVNNPVKPFKPVKFVLMNTTANKNKDITEKLTFRDI